MIPETITDIKRALYENDEGTVDWIVDFSVGRQCCKHGSQEERFEKFCRTT